MKPDVGHIRTFGCVAKVTLPHETLGKLRWVTSTIRAWIPGIGVKESRDVVFYEGAAPTLPTSD